MNFDFEEIKEGYLEVLNKYTVFDGRARRKEYWTFALVNIVFFLGLGFIGGLFGMIAGFLGMLVNIISFLCLLAILLPAIGVTIRRLHDTGRSGWWALIALIPLVGLILIYFAILDSDPGENEYGPNPKE
ncbi:MAG: DUF805 domain-containing protein [Syntrophobacterales bacterium]|jgi:uncharacterized membrane protein YhaH (DUF805 family)|nr:DUF805 domain-containing protein [Syntrophobacterales bacterium]